MATKTINLTTEAYERLKAAKKENESFSKVVVRSFPKRDLKELANIFTKEEVDRIRDAIRKRREISRKLSEEKRKKLFSRFR